MRCIPDLWEPMAVTKTSCVLMLPLQESPSDGSDGEDPLGAKLHRGRGRSGRRHQWQLRA